MSNEKFTKGPWNWEHDNDTASVIQVFSESDESKGDPDICRIQHEPNANLIAAAPDMYDALALMIRYARMLEEELLSRRVEVTPIYLDSPYEQPPEDVAESALAKARGEQ